MANNNFRIELAAELTLTEKDGKVVLFSKKTGDFFGLNETAGYFLKELCKSDFLTTLSNASAEFSVPETELSSDISELVSELESQKLVRKIPVS